MKIVLHVTMQVMKTLLEYALCGVAIIVALSIVAMIALSGLKVIIGVVGSICFYFLVKHFERVLRSSMTENDFRAERQVHHYWWIAVHVVIAILGGSMLLSSVGIVPRWFSDSTTELRVLGIALLLLAGDELYKRITGKELFAQKVPGPA